MPEPGSKASILTNAQRHYLREKQYTGKSTLEGEEEEKEMSEQYERKFRMDLRNRIIRGILDFDIIFRHLDATNPDTRDRDLIFDGAHPDFMNKSELTPREYLATLSEEDRTKQFGHLAEIPEEDLEADFERVGNVPEDPWEYYEGADEEAATTFFEDEDGEPNLQAIARHHRTAQNLANSSVPGVEDHHFREAVLSLVAFLLGGYDTPPEEASDRPDNLAIQILWDGLGRELEDADYGVRLSETYLDYYPFEEFEEAQERLENGEPLTKSQIELLQQYDALPEDARFTPSQ